MFEVSTAKQEVLERLVQGDWTPTDLATELGKSTSTIYNHLDDLAELGVLTEKQIPAKTRPKTEYSIANGFVQYISVIPGQYRERVLRLDTRKEAIVRIWNLPQEEFHPFLEDFWWTLERDSVVNLEEDATAIAVYGSVARGEADDDSDVDILIVAEDRDAERAFEEDFGTVRYETPTGSKIGITEIYNKRDYRNSLAHGSSFLENVLDELHVLYDPDRILTKPGKADRELSSRRDEEGRTDEQ